MNTKSDEIVQKNIFTRSTLQSSVTLQQIVRFSSNKNPTPQKKSLKQANFDFVKSTNLRNLVKPQFQWYRALN